MYRWRQVFTIKHFSHNPLHSFFLTLPLLPDVSLVACLVSFIARLPILVPREIEQKDVLCFVAHEKSWVQQKAEERRAK